jgi:hypothetical protein
MKDALLRLILQAMQCKKCFWPFRMHKTGHGMNQKAEQYIAALAARYGEPDSVAAVESDNTEMGMVLAISYPGYPQPELLTGFTCGLSAAEHSDWKDAKPELVITVQSTEADWVYAIAYLAEWQREKHPFAPGSLFHYGKPIAADSAMRSFLIFEPVGKENSTFAPLLLPNDRISLMMAYPLYEGEVSLIQKIGIRKFMGLPEYDFFSVNRPDLSTIYRVS